MNTTTTFAVDVIDGNGLGVSSLEVEACLAFGRGVPTCITALTGPDGRAHYRQRFDEPPVGVRFLAGRESAGPHRFTPGSVFVIES